MARKAEDGSVNVIAMKCAVVRYPENVQRK